MDIDQSPLSPYKQPKNTSQLSNQKAIKANLADSTNTAKINKAELNSSRLNHNPPFVELKDGQIIKGEVIDIRYNSISIRLEPGDQVIHGKLEANIPVSIGDTAQFQVELTGDSTQRLTLRYLPIGEAGQADLTVEKALTASLLPLTSRNKSIVEELLNHRMPIDKQTLQTLIRLSHANPNAAATTLVLMHKHGIPTNPNNIAQLELYQENTHQLSDRLHSMLNDLSSMLQQHDMEVKDTLYTIHEGLLNILNNDGANMDSNMDASVTGTLPLPQRWDHEDMLVFNKELVQMLEDHTTLSSEVKDQILSLLTKESTTLPELKASMIELLDNNNLIPTELRDRLTQLLHRLYDYIPPSNQASFDTILSTESRAKLAHLLENAPLTNSLIAQLKEGSASTSAILYQINEALPGLPKDIVRDLFASEEYKKVILEAFHERWTLSPKKLANKEAVVKTYQDLSKDLSSIDHLLKAVKDTETVAKLQQATNNTQKGLDFIKTFNEIFTYVPLPIHLKHQDVHGDLYVFTKKEELKNKKKLSVLLHLDMTHLGPINIHVQMNHNHLQASFYSKNQEAAQLMIENLPMLTSKLEKKGYSLHARVEATYDAIDFHKDFIEQDSLSSPVHRYSFDIRT